MNKIEELIKKHCPDGVEYVKFVDYANVLYGCPFDASKFTDDKSFIPLIRIRDVLSGKAGTYYTGEFSKEYIIKKGDVLVGMDGNFNLGVWDDIDGLLCQRVCKLYTKDENKLLNGYIRHYMKPVFRQIEESTAGGSVKHLSARAINAIEIPLPPLPVQEEIVRILDNFTTLEAELEAELEARRKQYEYYRDKLLNFSKLNGGGQIVEWKKLGEICKVLRGKRLTKSQLSEDGLYKVFHGGIEPIGYYNEFNRERETVMVINVGASAGTLGFSKERFWSSDGCFCLSQNSVLSGRFVYYYLQTKEPYLVSRVRKAGIPTLDGKVLEDMDFPLPPLSEQERIVSILDRFDTLVNDISIGLPAEIEARRKQYEYYRDKLLTFKRMLLS